MEAQSLPPRTQPSTAVAVLLELAPILSLAGAWPMAAAIGEGSGANWVLFAGLLAFSVSGLGWFYAGETRLGWAVFSCRLVVMIAAVAMGIWAAFSVVAYIGCESRCADDSTLPIAAYFWWAAIAIWIVAAIAPVVSAALLGRRLRRRQPQP